MYKATTLLKVTAILFIIGGVVGCISSLSANAILEWSEEVSGMDMGVEISMIDTVLGVVSSLITLVAGILALMSKQFKVVLGLMIVYLAYVVYDMICSIQIMGFSPLYVTSFVLPALFIWGLFASRIDDENQGEMEETK